MAKKIFEEDVDYQKYKAMGQRDLPSLVALVARKSDNLEEAHEATDKELKKQGARLDAHCATPSRIAHPAGINGAMRDFVRDGAAEDDVSQAAPKEGTIFFKGKVSGKWALYLTIILITIGGTFGAMKFFGA